MGNLNIFKTKYDAKLKVGTYENCAEGVFEYTLNFAVWIFVIYSNLQ